VTQRNSADAQAQAVKIHPQFPPGAEPARISEPRNHNGNAVLLLGAFIEE
jgi:hypothetical protein